MGSLHMQHMCMLNWSWGNFSVMLTYITSMGYNRYIVTTALNTVDPRCHYEIMFGLTKLHKSVSSLQDFAAYKLKNVRYRSGS